MNEGAVSRTKVRLKRRFHPDGVAALVAVMLAPEGASDEDYARTVDHIREQVLQMAGEYYSLFPCDFEDKIDPQKKGTDANNLAKLNRANLRG